MRSLFVYTENYFRGGGNRYIIDMLNGLGDVFDKIILSSNYGGFYESDTKRLKFSPLLKELNIISCSKFIVKNKNKSKYVNPFLVLGLVILEPFLFLYNVLFFINILKRINPNYVLSCNSGYPSAFSTLALTVSSKLLGIPVALSIVSMPARRRKKFLFFGKLLDLIVKSSADAIIVNANNIKTALMNWRGLPDNKIHIVYNGLENEIKSFDKLDYLKDRFVVGLVSRIDRAKGVTFLLEAFYNLKIKYSNFYLILAGDGDASAYISDQVERLGISNSVEQLGHYEGDIQELLSKFDIYAFPSLHEGFPYSILEAMRSGCSIVSTSVGGVPEAIKSEVEGILVSPSSTSELESAIERLYLDGELRKKMGLRARAAFQEKFSLDKMHLSIKEVFQKF